MMGGARNADEWEAMIEDLKRDSEEWEVERRGLGRCMIPQYSVRGVHV